MSARCCTPLWCRCWSPCALELRARLKIAKRLDDAYGPLKRRIDAHGVDVRSPRGLSTFRVARSGLRLRSRSPDAH